MWMALLASHKLLFEDSCWQPCRQLVAERVAPINVSRKRDISLQLLYDESCTNGIDD